jgi:hypothetical protein
MLGDDARLLREQPAERGLGPGQLPLGLVALLFQPRLLGLRLVAVPVEQPGRMPLGVLAVGGKQPLVCGAGPLAQLDDVGAAGMPGNASG